MQKKNKLQDLFLFILFFGENEWSFLILIINKKTKYCDIITLDIQPTNIFF